VALAVDVRPAYATGSALVAVSPSFTPAANSLLVAVVGIGNGNVVAGSGSSVITDSRAGTWTLLAREAITGKGTAEVWCRDGTTSLLMTVTATSQITNQIDIGLQVTSFSGAALTVSQTGATKIQGTASFSASITTTITGSMVVGAIGYYDNQVTLSASTGTTIDGQVQQGGGGDTEGAFHSTAFTGTPGAATIGCSNSTSFNVALAMAEILPAGSSVSKSSSDTGTGVDSATQTSLPSTDSGNGVDSQSTSSTFTTPDIGTGADSYSLGILNSDTSSSLDSGILIFITGSDLISGLEFFSIGFSNLDIFSSIDSQSSINIVSSSDSVSGVDSQTVPGAVISSGDASSFVESNLNNLVSTATDSVSSNDTGIVSVAFSGADTGSLADLGNIFAIHDIDSSSLLDSQSILNNTNNSDTGSITDNAILTIIGVDTLSSIDNILLQTLLDIEQGIFNDVQSTLSAISNIDLISILDFIQVLSIIDYDIVTISDISKLSINSSDSYSYSDSESFSVIFSNTDLFSGNDNFININSSFSNGENISSTEVGVVEINDGDINNSVLEQVLLSTNIIGSDIATDGEAIQIKLADVDSFSALDGSEIISKPIISSDSIATDDENTIPSSVLLATEMCSLQESINLINNVSNIDVGMGNDSATPKISLVHVEFIIGVDTSLIGILSIDTYSSVDLNISTIISSDDIETDSEFSNIISYFSNGDTISLVDANISIPATVTNSDSIGYIDLGSINFGFSNISDLEVCSGVDNGILTSVKNNSSEDINNNDSGTIIISSFDLCFSVESSNFINIFDSDSSIITDQFIQFNAIIFGSETALSTQSNSIQNIMRHGASEFNLDACSFSENILISLSDFDSSSSVDGGSLSTAMKTGSDGFSGIDLENIDILINNNISINWNVCEYLRYIVFSSAR
jgi:hypothetical protein